MTNDHAMPCFLNGLSVELLQRTMLFSEKISGREYWMIYRGIDFLASYDSAPRPLLPPPPLPIRKLCLFFSLPVCHLYGKEGSGRVWSRNHITRPWEILAFSESFYTLWISVALWFDAKCICRLELREKNSGGWFIQPTIITGLADQSRYSTP